MLLPLRVEMFPADGYEAIRRSIRDRTGMVLPDELIAEVLSSEPDLAESVVRTGEMDADDRARFTTALLARLNGPAVDDEPPADVVAEVRDAARRAGIPLEAAPSCRVDVRPVPGRPDAAIVELSGVLSGANADSILARFEAVAGHASTLILDLARLECVDAATLGPLTRISETVEETGARLFLASLPATMTAVCRAAGEGLALFLPPVYADVKSAVQAL